MTCLDFYLVCVRVFGLWFTTPLLLWWWLYDCNWRVRLFRFGGFHSTFWRGKKKSPDNHQKRMVCRFFSRLKKTCVYNIEG